jgi:branched-chain amino acid transport system ATP-binding protein
MTSLIGENLHVHFQGVKAIDGVNIALRRGEIFGLIGPNGAGKTTLMNALSGFVQLNSGRIRLEDRDVTGWAARRRAKRGLARTFQNVRSFRGLTVFENVQGGALGVGLPRAEASRLTYAMLERVGLLSRANMFADALSFGEEQRVGIARALATRPRFLLLDEPAAGLNEAESDMLASLISDIRDRDGCGVMLIEHDMRIVLKLCDRVHVLDEGKTISAGSANHIQSDPAVITAYLGTRQFRAAAAVATPRTSNPEDQGAR